MSLKINRRQLKLWIAALDSGKYDQCNGRLHGEYGYCCLGVGCLVSITRKLLSLEGNGLIAGLEPSDQRAAPQWLKEIDDDFCKRTGYRLSYLNDVKSLTFPEIATLLELVYIHKILD